MSLRRGGRFSRILQAVVGDDHAIVTLKWFRGGEQIAGRLVKGRRLLVSGEVSRYRFSKELIHPEVEFLAGDRNDSDADATDRDDTADRELGRVVPVYSAPEGMNPRTLRRLIGAAVDSHADLVEGYLPAALVAERRLPDVADGAARPPPTGRRRRRRTLCRLRVTCPRAPRARGALPARAGPRHAPRESRPSAGRADRCRSTPVPRRREGAALSTHRCPAPGHARDPRRSGEAAPDESPAPGRRRERQDRRGPVGSGRGRCLRRTDGSDGPDRAAGGATFSNTLEARRQPRAEGEAARRSPHVVAAAGRDPGRARAARAGGARSRRRYPRARPGRRPVP